MAKRVAAVVAVVVLIGAGYLAYRRVTADRYGPGTTHRVEIRWTSDCMQSDAVNLGHWNWYDGVALEGWRPGPIAGTLHVDSPHAGTFTADRGGKIHLDGGKNAFSDLMCSIR